MGVVERQVRVTSVDMPILLLMLPVLLPLLPLLLCLKG